MLDLQPRVHLHEIEILLGIDQELDRARPDVAHGARRRHRSLRHGAAHLCGEARSGRLLDDLLMAALHRAITVVERRHAAMGVREHLHLDVPCGRKIALEQQPVIAKGGPRQTLRGLHRGGHFARGVHDLHALAAAARARLDDQREPHAPRLFGETRGRLVGAVIARGHRHADRRHRGLGRALRSHGTNRGGRRSDELKAGIEACLRKLGVLRQKTIARMHRVGAHPHRKLDQLSLVQIALRRRRGPEVIGLIRLAHVLRAAVRIGIHRDAGPPQPPRGARNAADDLAAVRDQETFECLGCHGAAHIRKMPNCVATGGWSLAAASARPKARRVSAGSSTPSSQRRADA